MQKAAFQHAIDGLSERKRRPFEFHPKSSCIADGYITA